MALQGGLDLWGTSRMLVPKCPSVPGDLVSCRVQNFQLVALREQDLGQWLLQGQLTGHQGEDFSSQLCLPLVFPHPAFLLQTQHSYLEKGLVEGREYLAESPKTRFSLREL